MSGPSVRVSFMWMMMILRDWRGSKGGGDVVVEDADVGVGALGESAMGSGSSVVGVDEESAEAKVVVDARLRLVSRCGLRLRRERTSGSACILRPLLWRLRLRSEERRRSMPIG